MRSAAETSSIGVMLNGEEVATAFCPTISESVAISRSSRGCQDIVIRDPLAHAYRSQLKRGPTV
jgi:hypothetical protein